MKKLSAIDLDLMEKELPVLDQSCIKSVKGGYSENAWGCVFNCLEYIGSQWHLDYTDQDYYNSFKDQYSYDPAKMSTLVYYDKSTLSYQSVRAYNAIKSSDDMEEFFVSSGFDYTKVKGAENISKMKLNGESQIAIINQGPGRSSHAVIPLSVENGMMTYMDTTEQDSSGFKRYTISLSKVSSVYDMGNGDCDESGTLAMNVGMSGSLSGYYGSGSGYNWC